MSLVIFSVRPTPPLFPVLRGVDNPFSSTEDPTSLNSDATTTPRSRYENRCLYRRSSCRDIRTSRSSSTLQGPRTWWSMRAVLLPGTHCCGSTCSVGGSGSGVHPTRVARGHTPDLPCDRRAQEGHSEALETSVTPGSRLPQWTMATIFTVKLDSQGV